LRDSVRAMAQLRVIWHCEIFDTTSAHRLISVQVTALIVHLHPLESDHNYRCVARIYKRDFRLTAIHLH